VRFSGNKRTVDSLLPQLCREWPPPPLPAGYAVGDVVHWCGSTQKFGGDVLRHGGRGEVAGAAGAEPTQRVAVRFPGSAWPIDCSIGALSREWPVPIRIHVVHRPAIGDVHACTWSVASGGLARMLEAAAPLAEGRSRSARAQEGFEAAVEAYKAKEGASQLRERLVAALQALDGGGVLS
jgi:hypothetical protein